MRRISVDIDRIVLTDVGVTPDRAESLRSAVEVELRHLLEREGLRDNVSESDILHLSAPTIRLTQSDGDLQLASRLAQHIVQALGNI